MTLVSKKFFLRRSKMPQFLNGIEETAAPDAISVYMPPALSSAEIEALLPETGVNNELSQLVTGSKNGAIIFWGISHKCLVLPPFPLGDKAILAGYATEPLRIMLSSDFMLGLVLVHLGSYAVGLCQGEKLISSKVGTGLVHGRHRQGGSSQQRFRRRRENQIREFLDRVCVHVRKQLEPHRQLLDYVAYGGPRQTILLLQKRCPFLGSLEDRVLPRLDVPSPRQRVLEAAITRVWSSRIIEWQVE